MGRILQERIGATRRFPPGEELAVALAVAAGDLGGVAEAVLRRHGLNATRWAVLRMLRGAGEEGLPHSVIAGQLLVGSPDVTRMMDRMEEAGLVVRERFEGDRRIIMHRLTAAGRERLDGVEAPLAAVHESVVEALGEESVERLVVGCEAVIEAVRSGAVAVPEMSVGREER